MTNKAGWFLFAFFSLGVGVYPLIYLLLDMKSNGLLAGKPVELLNNSIYLLSFYIHISLGAISLFIGWIQFSKKTRTKYLKFHRNLGKTYIIAVLLSGTAGLYISIYASGGWVAALGFGSMAIFWLATTIMAFITIKKGDVNQHQNWMIRSYALCWAAVTLRIYLPTFQYGFGMEFISAYLIIAWLCWVPNLIVAEFIIQKRKNNTVLNI
jgi:uncharacterized membrane protein